MTTVLLVEDNALNRDMLSRRLKRMGYEVILAVDGQKGVEKARAHTPDIVLMDINMPIMDGWQATKILKEEAKTTTIPVIALTAHAQSADTGKVETLEFDAFATKPIDFPALVQQIESLLHQQITAHD